ncbi:MAG: hypothetical protein LR011_11030 [Verrucomicrobia bacterium]|nr:hypothetical protein [Verrucomicrobiota bacterium]
MSYDQELIGDKDDISRFFAGLLNENGEAQLAVYFGSSLVPDYSVSTQLVTVPQRASISFLPGRVATLTQDAGSFIRFLTLDPSGQPVIQNDYASSDLLAVQIPGISSQAVNLSRVPDQSGYYLSISSSQLDLSNPLNLGRLNKFILLRLDNSGGVVWGRQFAFTTGVTPLTDISAPIADNAYLYRLADIEIVGQSSVSHTKLIKINADGSLGFSKRVDNVRLSSVTPTSEGNDLYLGGFLSSPANPLQGDSIYLNLDKDTGVIKNSISFDQGAFDSGTISGVTQGWVFMQNLAGSQDPTNLNSGVIDLIRVSRDLSAPMGVRYKNPGFAAFFAVSDTELVFSPFDSELGTIGAFILDGSFNLSVQGCELFEPSTLTSSNPGTVASDLALTVSPSIFTVTQAPVTLTPAELPIVELPYKVTTCGEVGPGIEKVALSIMVVDDGASVQIEFPTKIGFTYDIRHAWFLSQGSYFESIKTIAGDGQNAIHKDLIDLSQGFYQVLVTPNP